jgi:hypothetical protein
VIRDYAWSFMLGLAVLAVTVLLGTQMVGKGPDAPRADSDMSPGSASSVPPSDSETTASPKLFTASNACQGNTTPQLVKVSVDEQHMWLCRFGEIVTQSPVTTGSVDRGEGTPLGTWQIESRETDRYLTGTDYRVFVSYWLPFFEDFGFHDSPWQTFDYGDQALYKTVGSRGCVHVPHAAMATLYSWAQVGTTVTITS